MDTSGLTLASLLLATGAVPASLVVRQFVELLKTTFPPLDARVSGAVQSFVASLVLYGVAFGFAGDHTPTGAFVAFVAWLGCATAAVGVNSTIDHIAAVRATPTPDTQATGPAPTA